MTLPWLQPGLFVDYQWDIASHLTFMWPSLQATIASPMMPWAILNPPSLVLLLSSTLLCNRKSSSYITPCGRSAESRAQPVPCLCQMSWGANDLLFTEQLFSIDQDPLSQDRLPRELPFTALVRFWNIRYRASTECLWCMDRWMNGRTDHSIGKECASAKLKDWIFTLLREFSLRNYLLDSLLLLW